MPATSPMMIAGMGPTKPAAGVMATSPATAPEAAPITVGLPSSSHAVAVQPSIPAAAAVFVTTKALTAFPSADSADPALNPNHPNQSRPAPSTTIGTLCGSIGSEPNPRRFPNITAAPSAATPELDVDHVSSGEVQRA